MICSSGMECRIRSCLVALSSQPAQAWAALNESRDQQKARRR